MRSNSNKTAGGPELGLVCMTSTDACRFRTITRTRYLQLKSRERRGVLAELYQDNLSRLHAALDFCVAYAIRLYRASKQPFSHERRACRGERAA